MSTYHADIVSLKLKVIIHFMGGGRIFLKIAPSTSKAVVKCFIGPFFRSFKPVLVEEPRICHCRRCRNGARIGSLSGGVG